MTFSKSIFCPFSKYSDIFQKPNTGVHQYRLFDVALVDYITTIILSFFLTKVTNIPIELSTIILFSLGIILHILFGVNTNFNKYFNISC